ncbi:MAG: hypothetical protein WC222_02735 [Parachlamydiales bacterium]|jgi:hypothetical protein
MTTEQAAKEKIFQWVCQPEATQFIEKIVDHCCTKNEAVAALASSLERVASTRLFDWVDYVSIPYSPNIDDVLDSLGMVEEAASTHYRVYYHPGAQLPRILVNDSTEEVYDIAIKVESVPEYLMVRGITGKIEGGAYSGLRRCCLATDNGVSLWVVERHGYRGIEPVQSNDSTVKNYLEAKELWQTRQRTSDDEEGLFANTLRLVEKIVNIVGRDAASWIVLEVERGYWQARNFAGQLQKVRQDQLGVGWANHDHHTFRSSRKHFEGLVRLFEMLGFHCRERFYAGQEAGWGAQVMENPQSGLVLFLDVDLSPEEIEIDFAHQSLPERDHLGTIGLWCALHGDSILQAGMHHLEAQFQFDLLREDLAEQGVKMMQPFSNFTYLKQAFTQGERWKVRPEVVEKLVKAKMISREEGDRFIRDGAIGSHMENLQRREGYKGFNQKNVSTIIRRTDPRSQ